MNIDDFRRLLPVNKHSLDDALEQQAELFDAISRSVAGSGREASLAKDRLARTEARLLLDIKESETKASEKTIDAMVKRDPDRIAAHLDYVDAVRRHEEWLSLQDAWRQRGYTLKTLGDLYIASYFDSRPLEVSSGGRSSIDARQQKYEDSRRAVREVRLARKEAPTTPRRHLRSS